MTAQDIQSCFYYVHADSEKDEELLLSEEEAGTQQPSVRYEHIKRKPVKPARPPPQALPARSSFSTASSIYSKRKPVGHSNLTFLSNAKRSSFNSASKVIGPRPLPVRPKSFDHTAQASPLQKENLDFRRRSELPGLSAPPLPLRPYEQKIKDLEEAYGSNYARFEGRQSDPILHRQSLEEDFAMDWNRNISLTLIRRYNELQVNAGKIKTERSANSDIALNLTSSGYGKFSTSQENIQNMSNPGIEAITSATRISDSLPDLPSFKCQLRTVNGTSKFTIPLRGPPGETTAGGMSSPRASLDRRDLMDWDQMGKDGHLQETPFTSKPSVKGFSFCSPWGGLCQFVTGVAGRSLKCRHMRTSAHGPLDTVSVSELRFNLPSSTALGSPASKSPLPEAARRSNRLSYFHRRQQSSLDWREDARLPVADSEVDADDRLDLSLGREHAGGGFGGKQAKLGKLIIEHEGLQMLDLIVAANMALWWKVYDKMG